MITKYQLGDSVEGTWHLKCEQGHKWIAKGANYPQSDYWNTDVQREALRPECGGNAGKREFTQFLESRSGNY